jgi:dienelactone hydrolase
VPAAASRDQKPAARSYARYARTGPYRVGVTTLSLPDRKVEVWYPAAKGATRGKRRDVYHLRDWLPPAIQQLLATANPPFTTDAYRNVKASTHGPFPLVVFSHGFGGYRDQSTFLTTHLASWGFVVVSPDFLERGIASALGQQPKVPKTDLATFRATVDLVRREDARRRSRLHGIVRRGKVAVVGHSAGARDAVLFARERDVVAYVAMAGAGNTAREGTPALEPPRKPSVYLAGAIDGVVPIDSLRTAYAKVPKPKRMVVIGGSGHLNGFSDICEIGAGGGGIVAIAQQAGLPVPPNLAKLGSDGCATPALPSRTVWPVTRHVTTAELRWAFRIDRHPVGLGNSLVKAFPGVTLTYSTSG